MNFGSLKEMNLKALLPKEIFDSLTCFTFVNPSVQDGAPDVVTCNTNGYMYEVKNKKIIRCLKLDESAKSVSCYYLLENENLIIFYLIYTSGQKLLIMRRTCRHLKVIKTFGSVREFQVYDFECLGYPQIKVTFDSKGESAVYTFLVESFDEEKNSEIKSSMVESLSQELQVLNRHIDDLTEECNSLGKICYFDDPQVDLKKVSVGTLTFSSSFKEIVHQKLVICDKWHKVCGVNLILGMAFCNRSCEYLEDIEVVIEGAKITQYSYGFFDPTYDIGHYLFSPREIRGSVKPDQEICFVAGFEVPEFTCGSEFSFSCNVTSSDLKETLLRETFRLSVWDIASKTCVELEEGFTVEDLMALMIVKSETRVRIKSEISDEDSMELLLVGNLGFKKINQLKDKLFYCTLTYLKEVFVGLRHVGTNPCVWRMVTYTSEPAQVSFLVRALCDLLPENTEISCE